MLKNDIQEYISNIEKFVRNHKYEPTLCAQLENIRDAKPKNKHDYAKEIGALRAFQEKLVIETARLISIQRKEIIEKVENESKIAQSRRYLKSLEIVNDLMIPHLRANTGHLNSKGSHSSVATKSDYDTIFNITIWCCHTLIQNSDSFFPKTLRVTLDEEEFVLLLKHSKNLVHQIAYLLPYILGCTISEALRLKPEDFNQNKREVHIKGKKHKDRTVDLPFYIDEHYLNLLPLSISARGLQKAFKVAAKNAGILLTKPKATFHSLRHSYIRNLLRKGFSEREVREKAGIRLYEWVSKFQEQIELEPNPYAHYLFRT